MRTHKVTRMTFLEKTEIPREIGSKDKIMGSIIAKGILKLQFVHLRMMLGCITYAENREVGA